MKTRTSLLLILSLLVWAPVHAANVAIMTSVFSPGATVKLESNGELTNVRHPVPLPSSPFSLTTGEGDMVQVQLRDGSYVRLAPHSSAKFTPLMDRVTVLSGTALIYFPEGASLHVADFRMQGNNSVAMLTVDPTETRVLPLSGSVDFLGDRVREGHIEVSSQGRNSDLGPTDLDRVKAESPLLVDLPGSPSLADILTPSKTGLRATINTLNTNARHEAELAPQEIAQSKFFGPNIANREGSSAIISDILQAQAPISAGTLINPEQTFAQITQNAINSRPLPPLPPASAAPLVPPPPPPPPPPALATTFDTVSWTIDGAGVLHFDQGGIPTTLAGNFSRTTGLDSFGVLSLTASQNLAGGGAAAFIAAGGKGIFFTSTSKNAGGNGIEIDTAWNLGNLSLGLTSNGSGANVTASAGSSLTTGTGYLTVSSQQDVNLDSVSTTGGAVTVTANRHLNTNAGATIATTGAAGTSGAAPTAGTAGGAVSLMATTGNITFGAGGAITANGGAGGSQTAAATAGGGAGGAGGAVLVQATVGTVTGGAAITSVGGTGGNQGTAGTAGAVGSAGAGGVGGAITLQAGGGGGGAGINIGALTSTGGNGGNLTTTGVTTVSQGLTAQGGAGSGGAGGAITVQGNAGTVTVAGNVISTGGNSGTLSGANTYGFTGSGGAGGNITLGNSAAGGNLTVTSAQSLGGSGDTTSAASKLNGGLITGGVVAGDGGAGGTVTINTGATFNATSGFGAGNGVFSKGGTSTGNTDVSQIVPKGGDGGTVTITAGDINAHVSPVQFASIGGNGGATGGSFASPNLIQKAGMGGNGGSVSVTTTDALPYAPYMISQGGNAGNTEVSGGFSQVFNGVGGQGGALTITQTNPGSTLDLSDVGNAKIGSMGGLEVASGAHGGSTSNGVNVNGALTINVGNNDLIITSPTAIANSGNGTASGYNRLANGGLGQSTTLNSGVLTITSRNLTLTDSGVNADGVGIINAGGSSVVISSTGNVTISDPGNIRDGIATSGIVTARTIASSLNGVTQAAITATGGVTVANATSVTMANGTANAPSIWNTGGTVNIDVSHGPGGAVVLGSNSIISSSTAPNFSGGQTPGNITITGSGLIQLNGQLFGVSAAPLAGIASGAITVNKTANGSTIDVGSAGRYGDPNAYVPAVPAYGAVVSPSGGSSSMTPSYTVYAQNGNAKVVGPPIVILASSTAQTVTPPPPLTPSQSAIAKGTVVNGAGVLNVGGDATNYPNSGYPGLTSPGITPIAAGIPTPIQRAPQYIRPFDDAQGGTVLITDIQDNGAASGTANATFQVIQPKMVGMLGGNAPTGPALYNFSLTPGTIRNSAGVVISNASSSNQVAAPQFLAVSTVARTGLAGGPSDLSAASGGLLRPTTPTLPASGTTVIVANQSGVTINR